MQTSFNAVQQVFPTTLLAHGYWLGGDKSPLNDADSGEDRDPEAYLDLEILGLDEFVDADKLDPLLTGDLDPQKPE